jgi:hypothetical protein
MTVDRLRRMETLTSGAAPTLLRTAADGLGRQRGTSQQWKLLGPGTHEHHTPSCWTGTSGELGCTTGPAGGISLPARHYCYSADDHRTGPCLFPGSLPHSSNRNLGMHELFR